MQNQTSITVFTGFLGSGKTTVIMNLVKQIPKKYKIVYLKNEFGNANVDSLLLQEKNIEVKEMINGCLCCVLVGRLGNALQEIQEQYNPNRIIIETNGTAYPAPIAIEINKHKQFKLDGIINVIDCQNYNYSQEINEVVRLQAEYTSINLLNKIEGLSEENIEKVKDCLLEVAPNIPILTAVKGVIDVEAIFGLDVNNFEFKTMPKNHIDFEVDYIYLDSNKPSINEDTLNRIIDLLKQSEIWRAKGLIQIDQEISIFNYINGKYEVTKLNNYVSLENKLASNQYYISIIGKNVDYYKRKITEIIRSNIN